MKYKEIRESFENAIIHSIIQEELYTQNGNYEQDFYSYDILKEGTIPLKDLVDSIMYDFDEACKELKD